MYVSVEYPAKKWHYGEYLKQEENIKGSPDKIRKAFYGSWRSVYLLD